jgi:hypothetical protein
MSDTDNRPPQQIFDIMQAAANGVRFPHPGPLYQRPIFPGNGYPPNPGEDRPGLSPFGRLAKGQPLGKSSILLYDATRDVIQPAGVDMLQVEGDNLDACQLLITLAAPRVIPLPFITVSQLDLQNVSGEEDNQQVTTGNFPGTLAPVSWPPLEAIIEWGVGGTTARAVIDYVNGVTVNVVASYLRVHAVVAQTAASGEIVGTSAAYYLAAFVGPGWAKTGTAKRTVYIGTVSDDAGESDVFDVPKFARRATIVGCDTSSPPNPTIATLRFWQSSDGVAGGNNVGNFAQSALEPGPFDVPNAAQYFSVVNQSAVPMKFSVIFELAL